MDEQELRIRALEADLAAAQQRGGLRRLAGRTGLFHLPPSLSGRRTRAEPPLLMVQGTDVSIPR